MGPTSATPTPYKSARKVALRAFLFFDTIFMFYRNSNIVQIAKDYMASHFYQPPKVPLKKGDFHPACGRARYNYRFSLDNPT